MADNEHEMAGRARVAVLDALEPILPKGSRVEVRVLLPGRMDNIEMTIGVAPTNPLPPGLRDGDPIGFVCGRCGWRGPRPHDGESLTQWRDRMAAMKPPSDLDTFRAMLERAGIEFELKEHADEPGETSLYVHRGYPGFYAYFGFDKASGALKDAGGGEG